MKNPFLWKQPGLGRIMFMAVASSMIFFVQIAMAHWTHSLTLLAAAYHMLYNILSLIGCIATIKMSQKVSSISNTFGWARLEVLSMVVNLLFLFALYFSIVVEVLQTLIHSDHMDSMHNPEIICIIAGLGIVLNGICILLIGGYTHHQGSFLALTPGGDVVIPPGAATQEAVLLGLRRLTSTPGERTSRHLDCGGHQPLSTIDEMEEENDDNKDVAVKYQSDPIGTDPRMSRRWPTARSILRDTASSVIVLITAIIVYVNGESFTSLLIDPLLTLVSVAILAFTSYPFMVQAGQILLQTTPAHIDVAELEIQLKNSFPSVVDIHDLHVWALTPDKVISTAHLVFMNETVYLSVKEAIRDFFLGQGITRITLQPEFYKFGNMNPAQSAGGCVLACNEAGCSSLTCCNNQLPIKATSHSDDLEHGCQEICGRAEHSVPTAEDPATSQAGEQCTKQTENDEGKSSSFASRVESSEEDLSQKKPQVQESFSNNDKV